MTNFGLDQIHSCQNFQHYNTNTFDQSYFASFYSQKTDYQNQANQFPSFSSSNREEGFQEKKRQFRSLKSLQRKAKFKPDCQENCEKKHKKGSDDCIGLEKSYSSTRSTTPDKMLDDHTVKKEPTNFVISKRHKTELCRNFEVLGTCKYEDKVRKFIGWTNIAQCNFAHGKHELRLKTHINLHYKIKTCNQFSEAGFCPYGSRCQYLHETQNYDEISTSYAEKLNVWVEKNPKLDMERILKKTHTL